MFPMLALPPNQIHLWFSRTDEAQDIELLERYRALLSAEERAQEQKFHFAEDAHRFLLTRALVRTVLSRYVDMAPAQWAFGKNASGKPFVSNTHAAAAQLQFNVSHTKGLVVLGVSTDAALGVDAECVGGRSERMAPMALMELAEATFSATELQAFSLFAGLATQQQQEERFFQHWTLKESYTKARGLGLAIPLKRVGFAFLPPRRVQLSLDAALKDRADAWNVWQFRPTAEHWVAVCAERRGAEPQQLRWCKTVPLVSEYAVELAPVWASN